MLLYGSGWCAKIQEIIIEYDSQKTIKWRKI